MWAINISEISEFNRKGSIYHPATMSRNNMKQNNCQQESFRVISCPGVKFQVLAPKIFRLLIGVCFWLLYRSGAIYSNNNGVFRSKKRSL